MTLFSGACYIFFSSMSLVSVTSTEGNEINNIKTKIRKRETQWKGHKYTNGDSVSSWRVPSLPSLCPSGVFSPVAS